MQPHDEFTLYFGNTDVGAGMRLARVHHVFAHARHDHIGLRADMFCLFESAFVRFEQFPRTTALIRHVFLQQTFDALFYGNALFDAPFSRPVADNFMLVCKRSDERNLCTFFEWQHSVIF